MVAFITISSVGILISILGIINMKGNISSLHWYHRKRVAEDNKKPMGKLVGLGTLLMGVSMIIFGALYLIFDINKTELFLWIGCGILIIGLIVGLALNLYAIIKYNKGLF